MKKLLTVLLAIIAIGITSQAVTMQAAETSQNMVEKVKNKATESVTVTKGQLDISKDWKVILQVLDQGKPGAKKEWGTEMRIDYVRRQIVVTRVNVAAETVSESLSEPKSDPLAELIWQLIIDRQPSIQIPKHPQPDHAKSVEEDAVHEEGDEGRPLAD